MKRCGNYWVPDVEQLQLDALQAGGWQLDRLEEALEHVTDWSLAVDGGAHIGSWTLTMAQRFARVVAFEPAPDTFECLAANIAGRPNISALQLALAREGGVFSMGDDERYEGGNTGGRQLRQPTEDLGATSCLAVALDSLDLPSLGFLKLDLEGWEPYAIRGARKTLSRCKPIVIVEDKPRFAARLGIEAHLARVFLDDLGARLIRQVGGDLIYGWPK